MLVYIYIYKYVCALYRNGHTPWHTSAHWHTCAATSQPRRWGAGDQLWSLPLRCKKDGLHFVASKQTVGCMGAKERQRLFSYLHAVGPTFGHNDLGHTLWLLNLVSPHLPAPLPLSSITANQNNRTQESNMTVDAYSVDHWQDESMKC